MVNIEYVNPGMVNSFAYKPLPKHGSSEIDMDMDKLKDNLCDIAQMEGWHDHKNITIDGTIQQRVEEYTWECDKPKPASNEPAYLKSILQNTTDTTLSNDFYRPDGTRYMGNETTLDYNTWFNKFDRNITTRYRIAKTDLPQGDEGNSIVQQIFETNGINENIYVLRDVAYGNWGRDIKKWNDETNSFIYTIITAPCVYDPGPTLNYFTEGGINSGFQNDGTNSKYGLFNSHNEDEINIFYPKYDGSTYSLSEPNQLIYTKYDCTLYGNNIIPSIVSSRSVDKTQARKYIESAEVNLIVKVSDDTLYIVDKHSSNKADSSYALELPSTVVKYSSSVNVIDIAKLNYTFANYNIVTNSGPLKIMTKKFGDSGIALETLRDRLHFFKFEKDLDSGDDNIKIIAEESNGIHAFLTYDQVAVAAALQYGAPIVIYNTQEGVLIFISKDLINSKTDPTKRYDLLYTDIVKTYKTLVIMREGLSQDAIINGRLTDDQKKMESDVWNKRYKEDQSRRGDTTSEDGEAATAATAGEGAHVASDIEADIVEIKKSLYYFIKPEFDKYDGDFPEQLKSTQVDMDEPLNYPDQRYYSIVEYIKGGIPNIINLFTQAKTNAGLCEDEIDKLVKKAKSLDFKDVNQSKNDINYRQFLKYWYCLSSIIKLYMETNKKLSSIKLTDIILDTASICEFPVMNKEDFNAAGDANKTAVLVKLSDILKNLHVCLGLKQQFDVIKNTFTNITNTVDKISSNKINIGDIEKILNQSNPFIGVTKKTRIRDLFSCMNGQAKSSVKLADNVIVQIYESLSHSEGEYHSYFVTKMKEILDLVKVQVITDLKPKWNLALDSFPEAYKTSFGIRSLMTGGRSASPLSDTSFSPLSDTSSLSGDSSPKSLISESPTSLVVKSLPEKTPAYTLLGYINTEFTKLIALDIPEHYKTLFTYLQSYIQETGKTFIDTSSEPL